MKTKYGKRGNIGETKELKERNDSIKEMRENGSTYDEISKNFGISRQRAHQIVSGYKKDNKKKKNLKTI